MTLPLNEILVGDVLDRLRELPADSIQCTITSPPYWRLRDYETEPAVFGGDPSCDHNWNGVLVPASNGSFRPMKGETLNARSSTRSPHSSEACSRCNAWRGQIGLEPTLGMYIEHMVVIFREVRRVLRPDGVLWLNMGDTWVGSGKGRNGNGEHSAKMGEKQFTNKGTLRGTISSVEGTGLKNKDLCMIPARVAIALQDDGWYLRLDNIWKKPNPMPGSQNDRPTLQHEYVFLLSKTDQCYYDYEAVKEPCTGNAHGRGGGIHSKIKRPSGWDPAVGWGSHRRRKGHYEPKQNADFCEAVKEIVTTRTMRSVWEIPTEGFPGELCQACDRYYEKKPAGGRCACGATDWLAHFATFPQKLVSKCLLAGTSERGACADCGTAWERIVEVTYVNPGNRSSNGERSREAMLSHEWSAGYDQRLERESRTVGWQPGCECHGKLKRIPRPKGKRTPGETFRLPRLVYTPSIPIEGHPVRPCVVLDPFMGSGTTGLVAAKARRDFVGIELHPKYAVMSRKRIEPELQQLKIL